MLEQVERDAKLAGQREDAFVAIKFAVNDASQPGIRNQLEASEARRRGDGDGGAVGAYAVSRGLNDGVGLGVNRTHAMAVLDQMTLVVAVRKPAHRSIVARGEDDLVANDHRADVLSVAGRTRGDLARDCHEVFV